jgi:hypothetical protein
MATVIDLEAQLRGFEQQVRTMVTGDDVVARCSAQGFDLGFDLAELAMRQAILDLATKGVLPDGRVGKIMTTVADAMNACKGRVVDDGQAETVSSGGLPSAGG